MTDKKQSRSDGIVERIISEFVTLDCVTQIGVMKELTELVVK